MIFFMVGVLIGFVMGIAACLVLYGIWKIHGYPEGLYKAIVNLYNKHLGVE